MYRALKTPKAHPARANANWSLKYWVCPNQVCSASKISPTQGILGQRACPESQGTPSDSRFTPLPEEHDCLASALSLSPSSPRPCAPGPPERQVLVSRGYRSARGPNRLGRHPCPAAGPRLPLRCANPPSEKLDGPGLPSPQN